MPRDRQGLGARLDQCRRDVTKRGTDRRSQDIQIRSSDQTEQPDGFTSSAMLAASGLFLNMSDVLFRNILVNEYSIACSAAFANVRPKDELRKYYEELLAKCVAYDSQHDRSDRIAHGKAMQWKGFCIVCTQLVYLQAYIFQIPFETVLLECKHEGEVRQKEATVRAAVLEAARVTPLSYEDLQQDVCYKLSMRCLLRWNLHMKYTGEQLIECYNTVFPACKQDRAAATARFHALLTVCTRLDAIVAPFNADDEDGRENWQLLCQQGLHLWIHRHALYEIYNYDPCQAMVEALEHAHRIPAPRKLVNRLQVTSQPSSLQLSRQNVIEQHGALAVRVSAATDGIRTTAYGDNTFMCLISDRVIYMTSNAGPDNTVGLAPGVMLVLHVTGLVDGDIEVTISTTDLVLAFEKLKRDVCTDTAYADVLDDVLAVNSNQLANLEQIGVRDASRKLVKFKEDLVRLLLLKQLKHNIPIIARLQNPRDTPITCYQLSVAVAIADKVLEPKHQCKTTSDIDNSTVKQLSQNPLNTYMAPSHEHTDSAKQLCDSPLNSRMAAIDSENCSDDAVTCLNIFLLMLYAALICCYLASCLGMLFRAR